MRMKFIWIGKLKERFAREGCEHYMKKLGRHFKLEELVLKDAPGKLPPEEKSRREGEAILGKLKPGDVPILLDEHGKEPTSRQLAKMVRDWTEAPNQTPVFIIGGPFGLSDEVKQAARHTMSLSRMTLPHELARLLLLEQLYRAGEILRGSPYHHD